MTRKEELKGRASKFMEVQDRYPYRTSIDMLHAELLQVEREVWEKVCRYLDEEAAKSRSCEARSLRVGEFENARESEIQGIAEEGHAKWARAQQQEIG